MNIQLDKWGLLLAFFQTPPVREVGMSIKMGWGENRELHPVFLEGRPRPPPLKSALLYSQSQFSTESGDPSIDSDSDPEDSPEPEPEETLEIALATQVSESSGDEEIPFVDEVGQEEAQSQLPNLSPLEEEDTSSPFRGPIKEEDPHDLEVDVVYRREDDEE